MRPTCLRGPFGPGLLCLLLMVAVAAGCVSPSPSRQTSPEVELGALLGELQDLRGGDFGAADDPHESTSAGRDRAAREGALQEALRALAFTHPSHVPTLVANAALAYERGDAIRAQKYLDQALFHDSAHVPATLLRVRIASEGGNLPFARRKLGELIEIAPDSAEAHEAYAGVLYLAGDHGQAIAELDLVDRLRGDDATLGRTSYHRGLIAEAQGLFDEAKAHYERCRELSPGFAPAARRWNWLTHR